MLKPDKEAIEYIDRICEDSVNHPAEFDTWPFKTEEERMKEDDKIAGIAQFIMRCGAKDGVDLLLEVVSGHQKMLESITWILKQMQGHIVNLEKRVYALEERPTKKRVSKY